eukprot:CAMPEP_0175145224 /NCGR_PEP_ID=MMETSP0087-20121206/14628_1 /TAXON_ID=136419 /ORGANISM="Unknown Unknown, Strain D1" /LENGTH=140 /DNA_ID=CAMNT_0016429899 /DNA_START=166 /DNA_END=588 /DNA_ORIENTATION=+
MDRITARYKGGSGPGHGKLGKLAAAERQRLEDSKEQHEQQISMEDWRARQNAGAKGVTAGKLALVTLMVLTVSSVFLLPLVPDARNQFAGSLSRQFRDWENNKVDPGSGTVADVFAAEYAKRSQELKTKSDSVSEGHKSE